MKVYEDNASHSNDDDNNGVSLTESHCKVSFEIFEHISYLKLPKRLLIHGHFSYNLVHLYSIII